MEVHHASLIAQELGLQETQVAAREKGLAPLARVICDQGGSDPEAAAAMYVDPAQGVASIKEALSGARDIIAEMLNEDRTARARLRDLFEEHRTGHAAARHCH
jgi:uncharacterized protein